MATSDSKSCVICMNDFDATDRQTVALPCGHNFCLTCLVCLKASDSPVCPQCRQSFEEVELPDSSAFVTIWKAEKGEDVEEKYQFDGCEAHQEPFVFWSNIDKEFYCITCIVTRDMKTCNLEKIQEAVPLIRKDLQTKAKAIIGGLTSDLKEHKIEREAAVQELENIKKFQDDLQKLNADFEDFIREVDYHSFGRRKEFDLAKKIEEQIGKIKSADDIAGILEYRKTLAELHISNQLPPKTRPATFLSEVASTYAEAGGQKVSFIKKLQQRKHKITKPKHRAEGNLSKMDIFILKCIDIRRMLFMAIFKRPHRHPIQQKQNSIALQNV